jgi:hypothetical protein
MQLAGLFENHGLKIGFWHSTENTEVIGSKMQRTAGPQSTARETSKGRHILWLSDNALFVADGAPPGVRGGFFESRVAG